MNDLVDITALIADRTTLFRHGLLGLLREHRPGWACAEAGSSDEILAHLRAEPVELLLFDLQLGGIAALSELRQEFPTQRIVVLADQDDRATILECLAAGASGYILKSGTLSQLLRAMETVLSGGVYAPAALAGAPVAHTRLPEATTSPLL